MRRCEFFGALRRFAAAKAARLVLPGVDATAFHAGPNLIASLTSSGDAQPAHRADGVCGQGGGGVPCASAAPSLLNPDLHPGGDALHAHHHDGGPR